MLLRHGESPLASTGFGSHKKAFGFTLALVILFLTGVVSFRSTMRLLAADREKTQSYAVLAALRGTLVHLSDAVASQRGFVIT